MMKHWYTPEILQNDKRFVLLEKVEYSDMKPFVKRILQNRSTLIMGYAYAQIIAFAFLLGLASFFLFQYFKNGEFLTELKWLGLSVLFSLTILVVIHELLHALAFLVLGKRDIGFGGQLRKFMFYAESNRQVLNSRQMLIVAFAPLVVVGIVSIVITVFAFPAPFYIFGLGVFALHFFF
ncbi:MAG TPA: DUF3267 domain-containing protein, partial [Prolixibacteraceae bacterium]|nr:DUF3267 domain-containing protein [Prolixibacteraceae bacterium]